MTISPPAKVKLEGKNHLKILASGIDSLYLTINVEWKEDTLFNYLASSKAEAKTNDQQQTVILEAKNGIGEMPIYIHPFGAEGL